MADGTTIRRFRREDEDGALRLLVSKVPPEQREAAYAERRVRWGWQYYDNPANPETDPILWVAESADGLVGLVCPLAVRLRTPAGLTSASWCNDWIVVQNLLEMNRIKSEDPLYVGKRLKIAGERKDKELAAGDGEAGKAVVGGRGAKAGESAGAGKTEQPLVFNYTVAKGDTLSRIANRFGMTLGRLLAINRLEPDAPLYVGKRLKIEGVPPEPDPTAKPGKRPDKSTAQEKRAYLTYRVKKGDTILNIAREQRIPVGTLLKLNGMKLDDPLHKDRILIIGYRAGE